MPFVIFNRLINYIFPSTKRKFCALQFNAFYILILYKLDIH